jgi:outer membrane biosynthesis protein TonB
MRAESDAKRSRRLGAIGAAVGIATAGVIAVMVTTDPPDDAPASPEPPRASVAPPKVRPTLPETPRPAPSSSVSPTDNVDAPKDAVANNDAKKRAAAIAEARRVGILGSTALQQGGAFASLTGTGDISSGLDDANIYGGLIGNEAGEMTGGFGYDKARPGGGGTGWGTIGTGRYGTIGIGSGTGTGYRRSSAVPAIVLGRPAVTSVNPGAPSPGELDTAIVRRYLRRNIQKVQYCYEKELIAKPKLTGTVSVRFTILESGTVAATTASGVDPEVSRCVANVVGGIEFPRPKGEGGVQVTLPFTFRPSNK